MQSMLMIEENSRDSADSILSSISARTGIGCLMSAVLITTPDLRIVSRTPSISRCFPHRIFGRSNTTSGCLYLSLTFLDSLTRSSAVLSMDSKVLLLSDIDSLLLISSSSDDLSLKFHPFSASSKSRRFSLTKETFIQRRPCSQTISIKDLRDCALLLRPSFVFDPSV